MSEAEEDVMSLMQPADIIEGEVRSRAQASRAPMGVVRARRHFLAVAWLAGLTALIAAGPGDAQTYPQGYVLFGDLNGQPTTDSGLFFDKPSKRLGIGVTVSGVGSRVTILSTGTWSNPLAVRDSTNVYSPILFSLDGTQAGQLYLGNGASFPVLVNANGNSYLNGGNVGIGTTAPALKLDVNGSIRTKSSSVATHWFSANYAVAPATPVTIDLYDAVNTLQAGYQYRIKLVTQGTSTPSGAVYVVYRTAAAAWAASMVSANGTTSNHPLLQVNGASVQIYHNHASAYTIGTFVEGFLDGNTSGPSAATFFGLEGAMTNVGGNVGIGTTTPANKLHVAGSITVDGNINAKYQDVAEWVPASGVLPAGTVVVIDRDRSNAILPSNAAYDTRIAGVVTDTPGLLLGEAGEDKAKVATTGRVKVRATASNGAIRAGDLLVTSDWPGLAMRSVPAKLGDVEMHRPGTLIGKALEPLPGGEGEILVLLSLQ